MKWVVLIIAIFSLALTPAEKILVQRLEQINDKQRIELADTHSKLAWTYKELQDKEPQLVQLSKERDEWKKYGEQVEPMKTKIAQKNNKIILLSVALGLLVAYNAFRLTPYGRFLP